MSIQSISNLMTLPTSTVVAASAAAQRSAGEGATQQTAEASDPSRIAGQKEVQAKDQQKQDDKEVNKESAEQAASKLQDFVAAIGTSLRFTVDEDSGSTVIKVMDPETQQVLRQIPSKEALELSKALDNFKGLLVKQQA
jgi:flagellar protein FlaG